MVSWFIAMLELMDVGDLQAAQDAIWTRIAVMTRYGHATLTEALCMIDSASALDYCTALGKLLREENASKPAQ